MTDISKNIDTYNGFVNGCDEYFNYISGQCPYDFGYLKDKKNLYNAWFANFVLFFAVFIENYMVLLNDEKYTKCFSSINGKILKEKKDNLRKLRNYLMNGSFYFQYDKSWSVPNIVLSDNEGEKVISFNSISNLYNEIVSVIFMLNSNKTSKEKAENCRLEYALFNNMNKISRLIGNEVFTNYEEYNPGYSFYHNDMVTAAILVNFYAVYNYGLETIFGPNVETVNEEQYFLKILIENENVDLSEFNMNLSLSGDSSIVNMIEGLVDKIRKLDSFFKEKGNQDVDDFNTIFHLRNSYVHAGIKIISDEQDISSILFIDRRGRKKTFEATISPWDFLDSIGYDNKKVLDNFMDELEIKEALGI